MTGKEDAAMKMLRIAVDVLFALALCALLLVLAVGFISEIIGTGAFENWLMAQGFSWGIPGIWGIGGAVLLSFAILLKVRYMLRRE